MSSRGLIGVFSHSRLETPIQTQYMSKFNSKEVIPTMRFNKYYKGLTTIPNKNDTRDALRNVNVTRDYTEASDGFILLRLSNQRGQVEAIPEIIDEPSIAGDEFIIPADDLAKAIQTIPTNSRNFNLGICYAWTGADTTRDVRIITATAKDGGGVNVNRMDFNTYRDNYPNTQAVVDRESKKTVTGSVLLDPARLERIARALKDSGLSQVKLEILEGEESPARFTGKNAVDQDVLAYLMPMRES